MRRAARDGGVSGYPQAHGRLRRLLDRARSLPARPLRASGLRLTKRGRATLAILLALSLASPLAFSGPPGALAEEDPDLSSAASSDDPAEEAVETLAGARAPLWRVQRPAHDPTDPINWTDVRLNAVHFPSPDVGYAAGGTSSFGVVMKTEDGGRNWREIRLADEGGRIRVLHDVHFVDESRGFAVGDRGVIVGTGDGGETWRLAALPSALDNVSLRGVHFPTELVGYVVGDTATRDGKNHSSDNPRFYTILKTETGGALWRRQENVPGHHLASGNMEAHLESVHFVSAVEGVAVGRNQPASVRGVLRTTDGVTWKVPDVPNCIGGTAHGVTLLSATGPAYAVGISSGATIDTARKIARSDDGFAENCIQEGPPSDLYDLTAYRAALAAPTVAAALDLMSSVLEEGPAGPLAAALKVAAQTLGEHAEEAPEPADEQLDLLAGQIESLADALEVDETWREVRGLLDELREDLEELLGAGETVVETIAGTLREIADIVRSLGGVDENVDQWLGQLAGGLDNLADALEGLLDDGPDLDENELTDAAGDELSRRSEDLDAVLHAVGTEGDLPLVMTRLEGEWVIEPIEDWGEHEGTALRGVAATPDGETVVAVGDGGLILRRTQARDVCVDPEVAEQLEGVLGDENGGAGIGWPDQVEVCPEGGERETSDGEVEVVHPPSVDLDPNVARPGFPFTVSGDRWHHCSGEACQGSQVTVSFRQGDKVVELGTVRATEEEGAFSLEATVPQDATEGQAAIRVEGSDPEPAVDTIEASMTIDLITPLSLQVSPAGSRTGESVTVSGGGWHACEGLHCEGVEVSVELRQGDATFPLGTAEANPSGGFSLSVEIPRQAEEGTAKIRAVGDPRPDAGRSREIAFDLLTPCRITVESMNPELPCLTRFDLQGPGGETIRDADLFYAPGLGKSGRVVGVNTTRVFLFDVSDKWVEAVSVAKDLSTARVRINDKNHEGAKPGAKLAQGFRLEEIFEAGEGKDRRRCLRLSRGAEPPFEVCEGERLQQGLKQRGVPGFARGFEGTPSEDGDTTGVVDLSHLGLEAAGQDGRRGVALDTKNHRVYLSPSGGIRSSYITAISLVGEFPPTSFTLPVRRNTPTLNESITHLAVDAEHSVVYAVTTAGTHGGNRSTAYPPTNTPQRDVTVHALPAQVEGKGKERRLVMGLEEQPDEEPPIDEPNIPDEVCLPSSGDGNGNEVCLPIDEPNIPDEVCLPPSGDGNGNEVCLPINEPDIGDNDSEDEKEGPPVVEPAWSLLVGDLCPATDSSNMLQFFGVGRDGRRLSLGCQGTDLTFAAVPVTPNGILTLTLPADPSVDELTQDHIGDILRHFTTVPGGGMGPNSARSQFVRGDQPAGIMTWRTGDLFLVWDLDHARWLARSTGGGTLLGADPERRRLYARGLDGTTGGIAMLEFLNLPGNVEKSREAAPDPGVGTAGHAAFDPTTRRMVASSGASFVVLEDRSGPPLPKRDPDPDRDTNDLDEALASEVSRRGDTAAYGARLWWTGLRGTLPGNNCLRARKNIVPSSSLPQCDEEIPGGTYEDLMQREWQNIGPRGAGPGMVPERWRPYTAHRDLFSARVDEAVLERSDSALGFSLGRSQATASGIHTGEEEGDIRGTDEDLRGRRGGAEWRDVLGARIDDQCRGLPGPPGSECRNWWLGPEEEENGEDEEEPAGFREQHWDGEQARSFDRCASELYDRLMREIDGERRVEHRDAEPCFSQFDQWDPHWNEDTEENEREGLEQHLGLTQLSECRDESADQSADGDRASALGSTVVCDFSGESTVAAAENALSTELPGGVKIGVDGSFSGSHVFRDHRGLVSEAVGVASGVSVEIPGVGSLRIGEVLTTAQAWANGRPGGASSELSVTYKDVRISTTRDAANGGVPQDVVVFSCDPHEDQAVVAGDGSSEAACNPEELVDMVAAAFGGRMTLRVPQRDLDETATGTPGGAQAIVQRNRVDYFNDMILFDGMDRPEVPGLQIEINADGSLANRFRLDLAAVYAETQFFIGDLFVAAPAPAMVEAPFLDHRQAATVQVALVDPQGSPLEGGVFELSHEDGFTPTCTTAVDGECELTPLPLGPYELSQVQAPAGFLPADPVGFELDQPGQVARITVVNGREGSDGSDVVEIIEIIEDARPAVATDEGSWWQRAARGLADVILRNPWVAVALAMVIAIVAAPGYLAARRRELSMMRELT